MSRQTYKSGRIHHTNPCLNTIPDTSHCRPVKNRPKPTPDTERGTTCHWESDVISSTNTSCCNNERTRNRVADPDANPRLPPRESSHNTGGGDHPCVDVEGVGNPEADIIPGTPLPPSRFNWKGSLCCGLIWSVQGSYQASNPRSRASSALCSIPPLSRRK